MRNGPLRVHRIAAKSPAKLVVEAALLHLFQREQGHLAYAHHAACGGIAQAKLQLGGEGEFGRFPKTAPYRVELRSEITRRIIYYSER